MKLKGLTERELRLAVERASRRYGDNIIFNREPERQGNFLVFTLRVNDSGGPGARCSPRGGRRMVSLCWHGHREVMIEIFKINPAAVLVTALARYEGQEGFEQGFVRTGLVNIGSIAAPMFLRNACDC